MKMPNFLIIGAAKAGTTALHAYLKQHPEIYMTPEKETNFFAFEGETLNFQGPGDKTLFKPLFPALMRQKIQHNNLVTPKLSSEVRQQLAELYREDILACQNLINRDLSAWLSKR